MKIKPKVLIPIIGIVLVCLPLIFSILNLSVLLMKDNDIGTTSKDTNLDATSTTYYCAETHVSQNTFLFDGVWFTHQNYLQLIWRKYNFTHYVLAISMESRNRMPDNYWLIGADNDFGIRGWVNFNSEDVYYIDDTFDSYEGIIITFFTLPINGRYSINVGLDCNNTHNSDTGDITVNSSVNEGFFVYDPTHNDSIQVLYAIITVIAVCSIIALIIFLGVSIHLEKQKQYNLIKPTHPPETKPSSSPTTPPPMNQNELKSGLQKCNHCGTERVGGASFCTSCGNKYEQ